ncbi:MAG: chemotaxis protein CheW [Ruminococcus sp.]|nr:chemotaxis protein CheW [Ruminococcus sp.]
MTDFTAVTFRCDKKLYAFKTDVLKEINTKSKITFVPSLPKCISGVINLMGDVIPVIDLSVRLGFEKADYGERSCLLIVENASGTAAVRVEEVLTSVICGDENYIEFPEDSLAYGVIKDKDNSITLLDSEEILRIEV